MPIGCTGHDRASLKLHYWESNTEPQLGSFPGCLYVISKVTLKTITGVLGEPALGKGHSPWHELILVACGRRLWQSMLSRTVSVPFWLHTIVSSFKLHRMAQFLKRSVWKTTEYFPSERSAGVHHVGPVW